MNPVKIIFHGHANLEIHSGPHILQIDPFYTSNPLADVKSPAAPPTHILLSHAHSDHIEDAEAIAKKHGSAIISNYEICEWYRRKGLTNLHHMNYGGRNFPFGRATFTLAFHSSTFPDGAYGGQPGGWIIEISGKTIYFAGDTCLFGDMALLGKLWNIDLACLPIGDNFTMGPAHALLAAEMLHPKAVLPIHYNTFPPIVQDAAAFCRDLESRLHIQAHPLQPGQSLQF